MTTARLLASCLHVRGLINDHPANIEMNTGNTTIIRFFFFFLAEITLKIPLFNFFTTLDSLSFRTLVDNSFPDEYQTSAVHELKEEYLNLCDQEVRTIMKCIKEMFVE